jgi:hypothetical protein
MTPEQEQRLGQMMQEHARKTGHVKKAPSETFKGVGQGSGMTDDDVIAQIQLFLRQAGAPVTRVQVIANINAGAKRTGRCLNRMHEAGTIKRLVSWNIVLWTIAD